MSDFDQLLIVDVVLAWIPAFIAQSKGRSFYGFWFYGILLFPVALIHSLILVDVSSNAAGRKCPFCAEAIKLDAVVCRFCGRDVPNIRNDTAVGGG